MPIKFVCPACFKTYTAPDDTGGCSMSCTKCNHPFVIPPALAPAAPVPPAPPLPRARTPAPVPPKEIDWRPEKREEQDDDGDDDESEEVESDLRHHRRRRERINQARTKVFIKAALILVFLAIIAIMLRVGCDRVEQVREHEQKLKGKR